MHVGVAVYGAARVVIGQPHVDVSFDASSVTLGQVLERLIAVYPRARPYLLDEAGLLPSYMRVIINNVRPEPDATYDTVLHDEDRVALLVAVAGGELPFSESQSFRVTLVALALCKYQPQVAIFGVSIPSDTAGEFDFHACNSTNSSSE